MCDVWKMVDMEGRKKNVYTMWVAADDQAPVRYEMMGFDSLIGSHYDKYVLDYTMYNTDAVPASTFEPPKSESDFLVNIVHISTIKLRKCPGPSCSKHY